MWSRSWLFSRSEINYDDNRVVVGGTIKSREHDFNRENPALGRRYNCAVMDYSRTAWKWNRFQVLGNKQGNQHGAYTQQMAVKFVLFSP